MVESKPAAKKGSDADLFNKATEKQWSDTTEEREKYQAEHQKDIDKIVEARKRELDAEEGGSEKEEEG